MKQSQRRARAIAAESRAPVIGIRLPRGMAAESRARVIGIRLPRGDETLRAEADHAVPQGGSAFVTLALNRL
jgi:hypothetical protein